MTLFVVNLTGCTSEFNLATGEEETLLYDTDREIKIGDAIANQVESHYELNTDFDVNQRVQRILDRIVAVCDRTDLVYTIKVIEEKESVNAVSLPGGYIYVFSGLIDKVKNDDQLAGVIAHEVGHITAKHGMKRLQASYGYMLMQLLAIGSQDAEVVAGTNAILTSVFLEYSRSDEFQSDRLGVKYLRDAGYDPQGMLGVLEILKHEQDRAPLSRINYFRTHPYLSQRMAVVNKEITGELQFKDYLNLTGDE